MEKIAGKYKNLHQDLINKCKNNDPRAQLKIYKLYYRALYNSSLFIVNNQEEAEDIMQEAFLSAFNKLDTYKGEVSFGAWLKRIVVNKSIDCIRKRKFQFEELQDYEEPISVSQEELFEETEETIRKIKEGIKMLPEGYRIVISLFLLEGYDHAEIAQIMNISESSSRSQLARAKKKLAGLLNKENFSYENN